MKHSTLFTYILFILALVPSSMFSMENVSDQQLEQKINQLNTDIQEIETVLQQSATIKANKKIKDDPKRITYNFAKWQIQNPNTTMADYYIFLNHQAVLADALPRYEQLKRSFKKKLSELTLEVSKRKARPEQAITATYKPKIGRI